MFGVVNNHAAVRASNSTIMHELDLSHRGLRAFPEEQFPHLRRVDTLYLSYNRLTSLPMSVLKLDLLRELHLCGNEITDISHLGQFITELNAIGVRKLCLPYIPHISTVFTGIIRLGREDPFYCKLLQTTEVSLWNPIDKTVIRVKYDPTFNSKIFKTEHIGDSCCDEMHVRWRQQYAPADAWVSQAFRDVSWIVFGELPLEESLTAIRLTCKTWRDSIDRFVFRPPLKKIQLDFEGAKFISEERCKEFASCSNAFKEMYLGRHLAVLSKSNIKKIDLSSLDLKLIPEELSNFYESKTLLFRGNKITCIPNFLTWFDLVNLDISNNKLECLPEDIGRLSLLKELILHHNELSHLPHSLFRMNLEHLDLSHNKLQTLPKEVDKLEKLSHLDVSSNELTRLPSSIRFMRNLEVLDLSGNELEYLSTSNKTETTLFNLRELLINQNKLKYLPYWFNEILMSNQSKLKKLHLKRNCWDRASIQFIINNAAYRDWRRKRRWSARSIPD